jgi:N-acetylglucosaminyldiphosphoundecaprenol N-acetyl-beta-D-mannosaminyltransferase
MQRIEIMGCPMDYATMAETVETIRTNIASGSFTQHVVVNVAKLVNMQTDPGLRESVQACDLINIDGMGVVLAGRFLGHPIPERVAGIDLFHELIAMSAQYQYPVFLLGAEEPVVKTTVEVLQRNHPSLKIAGYHHGFFWNDEASVVATIKTSGAKLLFVAITSPRKENFIHQWREELGVDFVMGVGGTFDVVAGKVMRAPVWMQRTGLEWLFRVLQEPDRLWKRYLTTNSRFLAMLIMAKVRQLSSRSPTEGSSTTVVRDLTH